MVLNWIQKYSSYTVLRKFLLIFAKNRLMQGLKHNTKAVPFEIRQGLLYLLWRQFSEQKLQRCSKVKISQNNFCKKKLKLGGCHYFLLIYDAPKLSTV